MAIQTQSLSGAEHDWFSTRSGVAANAPLNDHKRAYFASKGIAGTNGKKTSQMEREWLQTLTGVTSNSLVDMWAEAVAGEGLATGEGMDNNKFIFFTQVSTSP